ncbi:multifunctional CCA addition/repair protein [Candidatus Parabeggiatoa sp. HSG14]|uniref:multifunctional CCA addition/repair protein n=1 Tax=Candidatus Parabeggiatoa sp. HSG14 TaxID=3055593 RepID=UPI0025A6F8F0|nr:multifunctional CCA addition/repair protein [Thiotrichales bacterium HSG14]
MKIYQVGGAVRDKLLGHPSKDKDWVVVGATPDMLLELGYTPVGRDFPVFLHPTTREEYALARTERKTEAGYTGFSVYAAPDVTLESDLQRRDLTINAMAKDDDGQLIDPFNGLADLQAGILRHVSPAFVEDPVRILRVARFAARFDFNVAEETLDLMSKMVENGEVDALVAERVWQETVKALVEPQPQKFFELLRHCGALARIFPEIDNLFGVPQLLKPHPEIDTGVHVMLSLQQARRKTNDSQVLFAVLTHDLGKGTTPPDEWPYHSNYEEHGIELVETLCQRYRVPSQHRFLAILVARYHEHCHHIAELTPEILLNALESLDAFRRPQRFEQFLLASEADSRGRDGFSEQPYPQADMFRQAFEIAHQVKVFAIQADGFHGAEIKEELRRRRIQALAPYFPKAL